MDSEFPLPSLPRTRRAPRAQRKGGAQKITEGRKNYQRGAQNLSKLTKEGCKSDFFRRLLLEKKGIDFMGKNPEEN